MGQVAEGLWAEPEDLWSKRTITVAFLGSPCDHLKFNVKDIVKQCAECWTQDADIAFQFIDDGSDRKTRDSADVRITFDTEKGSWSVVGNKVKAEGQATMNLAIIPAFSEATIRRKALHEFGHALGFRHEHASPNSKLRFDKSTLAQCTKDMKVDEAWLKKNFEKPDGKRPLLVSEFDKDSIMIYRLRPEWNVDKVDIPWTTQLSKTDKEMVKKAYPFHEEREAARQTSIDLSRPGDNRTLDNGSWGCDYESCKPAGRQCDACYRYGKNFTLPK